MSGAFEIINKALFFYVKTDVASQMSNFGSKKTDEITFLIEELKHNPHNELCGRYPHLLRLYVTAKYAEKCLCTMMLNPLFSPK